MALRRTAGLAAAIAITVMGIAPEAQVAGSVAGTVTDAMDSPLAGVQVTLTTTNLQRTVVTDSDGRYHFTDLPVGTYTARAELAGFETAIQDNIVVPQATVTRVSFVLALGCLYDVVYVDMGFAGTVREANAIIHIRIAESSSGERCPETGLCVCTAHLATVRQVLKPLPPGAGAPPHTIRLLQERAGHLAENGSGAEEPYAAGQEYVSFLRWDASANRFSRMLGPIYMFPVRNGRVEFRRTDAPELSDGMPVEAFTRTVRTLLLESR